MPSSICIDSHEQIILIFSYFDGCIKITTFKGTIKNKFLACFNCGVHALEESAHRIFRFEIRVKFLKVCSHVEEITINKGLMFESILVFHFGLYFETRSIPISWISKSYTQVHYSFFIFSAVRGEFIHNFINDSGLEV